MRKAFTLAEVLITLAIIGVVAAMTIPTLLVKINEKIKANQIKIIQSRLIAGTDKLMLLGSIMGHQTTESFIKELSEHYKIGSYCVGENVPNCFPYTKINVEGADEPVEVKDLTSPEAFGLSSDEYGEPVSFITAGGTPFIIMYKKTCDASDIDENNYQKGQSINCIAGIYDYNGSRTPNKFTTAKNADTGIANNDIQFLGPVTQLSKYVAYQADGYLLNPIGAYKAYKITDSTFALVDAAKAQKYCEDMNMELPSYSDLISLYCMAKGPSATCTSPNYTCNCSSYTLDNALYNSLSAKGNFLDYYVMSTGNYGLDFKNGAIVRNSNSYAYRVICLGK